MATVAVDHHLHVGPGDDHLFHLCQLWKVGRNVSWVHLVLGGHEEGCFAALISQEAGVADVTL